jgi:hypothetical protein
MSNTIARIAFITFLIGLTFYGAWISGIVLKEPDICFLLATGRWICQHGCLPVEDPFAWTLTLIHSQPILEQWLTEVLFYGLYQMGSGALLLVFDAIVLTLTFSVLPYRLCRLNSMQSIPSLLLVVLCELCSFSHLTVRPEIFSALFVATFLELLSHLAKGKQTRSVDWRYVLAFSLMMVFWVNLHGLWIFGPVLLAGFLGCRLIERIFFKVGEIDWTIGCSLLGSIVVLPINPYGFKLLQMISEFFLQFGKGGFEPHVREMNAFQYSDLLSIFSYPFLFLSALGALAFFRGFRKPVKPGDLFFALMVPAAIIFGFKTLRAIPTSGLFLVAGISHLLIARKTAEHKAASYTSVDQAFDTICPPLSWRWAFTSLAFSALGAYLMTRIVVPEFPQSSKAFAAPFKAVSFISTAKLRGNLFNDPHFGDVMMWQLPETPKLFIDSRYFLFPPEMVDEYWTIALCRDNWKALMDKYQIDWIFLPPNLALVNELSHRPDWKVLYQDKDSVVISRITSSSTNH